VRWLLTVGAEVDLHELCVRLAPLETTVDTGSALPLDDGGRVVAAEGPDDLPARLERSGVGGVTAYPDSDLELYEP
jgi:hypothetical protein